MVSAKQKKTLKKFLSLATNPEEVFTYDELMGYLFGIAMTPDILLPSEWLPAIFGNEEPQYSSPEQAQEMIDCLMQVYNSCISAFQAGSLELPFDVSRLKAKDYESISDWLYGFEAALALRPEIWEPEEQPHLSAELINELYSSLMIVQGLTDPETADSIIENMPEEIARETFPPGDAREEPAKTLQLYAILLASLPKAVNSLQRYARIIERKLQQKGPAQTIPLPIRPPKIASNDPCHCKSCGDDKNSCCPSNIDARSPGTASQPVKKAKVIQGNFPQRPGKTAAPTVIYQLKISLMRAKPPIWRRVQVPAATTLLELHTIIQHCMGWSDSHLHQFIIDKIAYALPDEEDGGYLPAGRDERRFSLEALEKQLQPHFRYIYDFGDSWEHRIDVEKIVKAEEGSPHAVLLAGKRACPPEDIGGIYSYMGLVEILDDPDDEQYNQAVALLGEDFQPEEFSKKEIAMINSLLKA